MLVAHVEQDGVWLVRGGMQRVADALRRVGEARGARYRFGCEVARILVERGRARGVLLASGERLDADAVVFNGDVAALSAGLLGDATRQAAPGTAPTDRSLSALTWCMRAPTSGFELEYHNVFFAEDYAQEFDAIFRQRRVAASPTVYVCAQDRGAAAAPPADGGAERLLVLVNAPADGDRATFDALWVAGRERDAFALLQSCGLRVGEDAHCVPTTPADFERLYPASGGALYGAASVGALSTFRRSGSRTRVPGLFLAGGSVHPGPGVPMAAMSGRLAAAAVLQSVTTRRPRSTEPATA
jgi:1-hydroxycarotenoid 3,4-desaturase